MHQPRRRKKRPSYGVRTVEISRGKNGFGFTISGQAPCILSCIVTGSPAEKAGLRPGDFLIAVNGTNVSKALHDDVVRLMAATPGVLKLQIAENYYSDSSDEEIVPTTRTKPKYPHRLRNRHHHQNGSRAEKVVRDLQTGALFIDHLQIATQPDGSQRPCLVVKRSGFDGAFRLSSRSNKALLDLILQQKLKEVGIKPSSSRSSNDLATPSYSKQRLSAHGKRHFKPPKRIHNPNNNVNNGASSASTDSTSQGSSSARVFSSVFSERELNNILYPSIFQHDNVEEELDDETHARAVLRAVVGYLGTIEMPKEPQLPSSRLQAIRNCIRRLRIEKKIHTLVLLSVFPESVLLTNPHGLMLAEFPAEKITFSGVYADDKKFFGLVTSHGASSDELSEGSQEGPISISSSCHVFLVDPKLQPHHMHLKRAKAFRITCTPHPLTNRCREFPESADVILQAIVGLYRNRMGLNVDASAIGGLVEFNGHVVSPQPSNTSSNSSNSDSGIGFRDEGNTSDRVFVVDVENYNRYRTNSLDRQSFSVPSYSLLGGAGVPVPGVSGAYRTCNAMASQQPNFREAEEEVPPLSVICSATKSLEEDLDQAVPEVTEVPPSRDSPKSSPESGKGLSASSSTDRLTVRVMPDPPAEKSSPPRVVPSIPDIISTSTDLQSNLRPGVTQRTPDSPPKPEKSTGAIPKNRSKTATPSPVKDLDSRLSPKVYDLELPPSTSTAAIKTELNPNAKRESRNFGETFERRIKTPGGSRSLDDLHLQSEESELGSCEVIVYRRHHGVNGRSRDPNPYASKDDSDSQVEYSFEATRKWARTSSLRRHLRRKRSIHRSPHDAGTMSDGEIANGSIGVSSCSSLLGLDHVSDTTSSGNLGIMTETNDYRGSERAVDVGRVGSWAAGFNHLLQDPAGLHTFSEFLKKEFSQENILFWIACERYRKLRNVEELNNIARELYVKHLSVGALEPVNVDSHARQVAQEGLQKPTPEIFIPAQKQIFNLMKFDCYQRFLKSQLFKECMMLEMQGRPLPYNGEDAIVMSLGRNDSEASSDGKPCLKGVNSGPLRNNKDDQEERKKKSLLPWARNKSNKGQSEQQNAKLKPNNERNSILRRSNKKKKKELTTKSQATTNGNTAEDAASDLTGSRSSLASSEPSSGGVGQGITHSASRESLNSVDLSSFPGQCGGRDGGCHLCRVILPDRSTTVVKTQTGESIAVMLQRLLERRNLTYTAIDAYVAGSEKAIDQNLDVASLGCKEIRVEQRVLFRLDLPKDKTVGVKAKPGRVCGDALTPILQKYGLKMDDVFMRVAGSNRPVVYSTPVHTIDNQRIIVKLKEDFRGWDDDNNNNTTADLHTRRQLSTPVSDEVTNRIFELLLKGKSQHQLDELGIVDFEEGGRKRYGIIDTRTNLGRRNSVGGDKGIGNGKPEKSKAKLQEIERERARKLAVGAMPDISRMSLLEALSVRAHSPPTQQCVQNLVAGKPNRKDLLEVWKRAQSSRLDDQRGTEINSELPDFLKVNKEKLAGKENCLKSPGKRSSAFKGSKDKLDLSTRGSLMNHYGDQDISPLRCIDSSFITDGILPTGLQAEEYFSTTHIYRPSLELANNMGYRRTNESSTLSDMRLSPSVGLGAYSELRTRPASCNPGQNGNAKRIPQRPASNPLPHLMYPRPPPTRRSPEFYPYEQYFCNNLRSSEGLDNLLMSSMEGLDLDFDLDVTLKASPPTTSDDSFSPNKIPHPTDLDTTIQAEEANFSPPPVLRQFAPPPNGRRFKTDPPPLPPKVKTRGPPPRPPSRQQLNVTPSFGQSTSDDHYNANIAYAGVVQDVFRRKSKQLDNGNSNRTDDKFNISFV